MKTPLQEYGFWDYTTPGAGGMSGFGWDDYQNLLDDMAAAGMNSLVITVKWWTTGYRSRLSFLDQLAGSPVIESDNHLLRGVIDDAKDRGIRVWLGAVVSIFEPDRYGFEPYEVNDVQVAGEDKARWGVYDADSPAFCERAVRIAEELVTEFPAADGLEIEMEGCGRALPRRAALYNAWAADRDVPSFNALWEGMDPRGFDARPWRDYATARRLDVMEAIEQAVRGKGFAGDLATILETCNGTYCVAHELNLAEVKQRCGDWTYIAYEYDKWRHRHAMMEFCLDVPKREGLKLYYLPRGVMTWAHGVDWPLPIPLEESWAMDIEDIQRHEPDGVWWFGCGGLDEGAHVSLSRLRQVGYNTGAAARKALIERAACFRQQG